MLVVLLVGAFAWWQNNKQQQQQQRQREREAQLVAKLDAARPAPPPVDVERRRRECQQFVRGGGRKPDGEDFDLVLPPGVPRGECDDEGNVVCQHGWAPAPRCDGCAEGHSGSNCHLVDCETALENAGGSGTCDGDRAICDPGFWGANCERRCEGNRRVVGGHCICPANFLFRDRDACAGECLHDTVTGEHCNVCKPGTSGLGGSRTLGPTASQGCPRKLADRTQLAGVEDITGQLHRANVCDLTGCNSLDDLNATFGTSNFNQGIAGFAVAPGFRGETFPGPSCTGTRNGVVRCDSTAAGCNELMFNDGFDERGSFRLSPMNRNTVLDCDE